MTVTSIKRPATGECEFDDASDMHTGDQCIAAVLARVERALAYGAPVLIRGETGTGKGRLARYIHKLSGRTGPFVAVNCAAIPESLIEAELFGYQAGAFTGARQGGALGLVREANGGTLFLDEIGDMPLALQGRLLQLFDTWRVRPVGAQQEYEVDVHLLAATNCDLEQAVANGRFRLDLLHRIKVVEACLPALCERTDFDSIARFLLAEIEPRAQLDEGALDELRGMRWEGNIRELNNVLLRLVIFADGAVITKAMVRQDPGLGGIESIRREFGPVDDSQLSEAFRRCRGNVAATARELHISRTTAYKHLRRLGAVPPCRGGG